MDKTRMMEILPWGRMLHHDVWLALSSGLTLPNEKCITDCDADDAVDSQGTLPGKNGAESTVRFFVFFEKLADLQIRKELEIWPLCSWGFTTRDIY